MIINSSSGRYEQSIGLKCGTRTAVAGPEISNGAERAAGTETQRSRRPIHEEIREEFLDDVTLALCSAQFRPVDQFDGLLERRRLGSPISTKREQPPTR